MIHFYFTENIFMQIARYNVFITLNSKYVYKMISVCTSNMAVILISAEILKIQKNFNKNYARVLVCVCI